MVVRLRHFLPVFLISLSACAATWDRTVEALIEAGHWKRARAAIDERLRANPDDGLAHAWRAKTAIGFGDLTTAMREGERGVELAANEAAAHSFLAESYALMADRSGALRAIQYVRKMKREVDAAFAIDPKHLDTLLLDTVFSFKAPAVAGGDRVRAWRRVEEIQRIAPAWGYLARARLMQLDGQSGAPLEAVLKKAVAADPAFYRARLSLATFYCSDTSCPNPGAAEKAALEAIAVDPGSAQAYTILARSYVAAKRWPDMEAALARAEKAAPDDLAPYYSAAERLLQDGQDFDRAERYLRRYLTQPPEGREPTQAEAHRLLGSIYEHSGRRGDALREVQIAVSMQPDNERAKKDLSRLRQN